MDDRSTTSVMARAAALLHSHSPSVAAHLLIAEVGWDTGFQTLALLRGEAASAAFGAAWQAVPRSTHQDPR